MKTIEEEAWAAVKSRLRAHEERVGMTNRQLISQAMQDAGLDPINTKVDTFNGWNKNNYRIKSGEKAVFKTKIWKPVKRNSEDGEKEKMILVNAAFFTDGQVERSNT